MKSKVKIISSILLIVIISISLLALTSCTKELDYAAFKERAEQAVSQYDSNHGGREGTIIYEDEYYEFEIKRNSNDNWYIEFDESVSDFDKTRLNAAFSKIITMRVDDYNADSAEKFGLYVGFEDFQFKRGFEIESDGVALRFDEFGFFTDLIEDGEKIVSVNW